MNRLCAISQVQKPYGILSKLLKHNSTSAAAAQTTSTDSISIPKAIKRGPVDILRALSATVGHDKTGVHYKFHDDPYLIPRTESEFRSFTLSKESGKRAASYFVQEMSNLFQVSIVFEINHRKFLD